MSDTTDTTGQAAEQAEKTLIACALLEQAVLDSVAEIVRPADFYSEPHRTIWTAMLAIHRDGADVDILTLSTELQRIGQYERIGGAAYLSYMLDAVPAPGHPDEYARMVARYARRRHLAVRARQLQGLAADDAATESDVEAAVGRIAEVWEHRTDELPTQTAAEIERLTWPDRPDWLIRDWWALEGCGWLSAYEKSGKTILALGMALSVATGRRWLGRWVVAQGPVVFAAEEDHIRRMQRRLRRVGTALDIDWRTSALHIAAQAGTNIATDRGRGRLAAVVRRVHPILLIVDPWRRVTPGVDENDSERVSAVLGWLRRLQAENHCAVMVLDHWRKPGGQAGKVGDAARMSHRMRGSGDKAAWYDSMITIVRRSETEHRVTALHRDGAVLPEQQVDIVWDDDNGSLRITCRLAPRASPVPLSAPSVEHDEQLRAF